ncbi:hypothetical protein H920_16186 [Fukomys damarensis]|uniref:Uncharacterized protein n=1 Tax=Fukomys damarensis TaxID=885580 RepID=A0A091CX77_FUKDA|nr:hypothetical protein H920_16186 [Fukomys damarensis]
MTTRRPRLSAPDPAICSPRWPSESALRMIGLRALHLAPTTRYHGRLLMSDPKGEGGKDKVIAKQEKIDNYCLQDIVLVYEPENPEAKEFSSLIEEMLMKEKAQNLEEESGEDSSTESEGESSENESSGSSDECDDGS